MSNVPISKISESLVSLPHQFQQKTFPKGLNLQKMPSTRWPCSESHSAPPPTRNFSGIQPAAWLPVHPALILSLTLTQVLAYLLPCFLTLYLPFSFLSSLTLGIPIHFYIGNFAYIFVVSFHSLSTCFIFHRPGNLSKDLDPSLNSGSS